jgi:hypothetical protein
LLHEEIQEFVSGAVHGLKQNFGKNIFRDMLLYEMSELNVEISSIAQLTVSTIIHIVIVAETVVEYRRVEHKSHPFHQYI